ncbi:unnamed protein product [Bemisia tabaci]|uniref:PPM-type phosphatase domain-containing protein n=1 Tax=Bemisia tabaci TaxID=7038 RepID=A0A9P0F1M1_BEMTA|nr:unnamed protein product [Bemisia tabaci]
MAVGSSAKFLVLSKCVDSPGFRALFCKHIFSCGYHHSSKSLNQQASLPNVVKRSYTSDPVVSHSRLTPQEVTDILREKEFSLDLETEGSVLGYDSNQLASNNPIEDFRAEAKCVLTTGMLFGVFDGHGGALCAQVLSKRLFEYISASLLPPDLLLKYLRSPGENQLLKTFNDSIDFVQDLKLLYAQHFKEYLDELSVSQNRDFQMKDALEKAFLSLDADLSREAQLMDDENVNMKTLSVGLSGAVSCVAHIDGPHLHVASVGDCQAILGVRNDDNIWTAKKLSIDHNSDNAQEVQRVLSEHPQTEHNSVIRRERLLGQLAPLRAFGDFRYKWDKKVLEDLVVPILGDQAVPHGYFTPPYLTARPDITHHVLTPRDKFLVIATDGLWDEISPLQVVRLVGEHMSGKVILNPLQLPRKSMTLNEINDLLLQRQEGLKMKPIDSNAATHLIRNALGGSEYGIEHSKIAHILSLPQEVVRLFRDDITVTVVYFNTDYLRHTHH